MKRKDGLSCVFKMFLGDIIHSEKRDTSEIDVLVNKMEYTVNDSDFNKIILDYRGNPSYVKMISKVCEYNPRNEFILEIIGDIVKNKDAFTTDADVRYFETEDYLEEINVSHYA